MTLKYKHYMIFSKSFNLGQVQTPYFTWAELNANEREQRIFLICIRFGSCEVRRLNMALKDSLRKPFVACKIQIYFCKY